MTDIPILDDEYWKALEILAEEVGCVKECGVQKLRGFQLMVIGLSGP